MASPYTLSKEQAEGINHLQNRVRSTFSSSICGKVPNSHWASTAANARAILLLPVRLTRNEKEEILSVLEANRQS